MAHGEFGAMGGTSIAMILHRMISEEFGWRGEFQVTESLLMCAADRAVTARLKQSLALVDIRLLDHFVIGDGPPVSLAARGWV